MQRKKVLLVATVQSHICQFHLPLIDLLHKMGCEVHVAARNNLMHKKGLKLENADKVYDIQFERSPFKKENIKAYKQIKKILKENNYDIIHCNTPMGGVIARLAGRKYRKRGLKIIYTAHGFHFFKGAPLINWIIYYPIEKILSKCTDFLVTINMEDYEIARKKLYAKETIYMHGVGLNTDKFEREIPKERLDNLRDSLNINNNDFVIIYVAELTLRKNHYMILETMKQLKNIKNIKLLLAGNGPLDNEYKTYIRTNEMEDSVIMLGYRTDIPELMQISNIAISTSKQEGLPVNVMEAMKSALPDVVTDCRGNRDLIKNGKNGYIVKINDTDDMYNKIMQLYRNKDLVHTMGKNGKEMVKIFEINQVLKELKKMYLKALK